MPAGSTYTPIATTTLGSSASSYTFSSIPSTYTDLVLIANAKNSTYTASSGELRFNSDTGTNYSSTAVSGSGSAAASYRATNATSVQCFRTDINDNGTSIVHIQNYANTTTYKTVVSRGNTATVVVAFGGLWRNTSAITSITVKPEDGTTFSTGSVFTLYGITAA